MLKWENNSTHTIPNEKISAFAVVGVCSLERSHCSGAAYNGLPTWSDSMLPPESVLIKVCCSTADVEDRTKGRGGGCCPGDCFGGRGKMDGGIVAALCGSHAVVGAVVPCLKVLVLVRSSCLNGTAVETVDVVERPRSKGTTLVEGDSAKEADRNRDDPRRPAATLRCLDVSADAKPKSPNTARLLPSKNTLHGEMSRCTTPFE